MQQLHRKLQISNEPETWAAKNAKRSIYIKIERLSGNLGRRAADCRTFVLDSCFSPVELRVLSVWDSVSIGNLSVSGSKIGLVLFLI